jgi:hypothetical protein
LYTDGTVSAQSLRDIVAMAWPEFLGPHAGQFQCDSYRAMVFGWTALVGLIILSKFLGA